MRRDFARAVAATRAERGAAAASAAAIAAVWDLVATAFMEYAHMLVRDLRFALRSLRRTPFFTAVIVATLAIAIGANAAVFSIVHAVVLAPLPYAQPDRLVAIRWFGDTSAAGPSALPDFDDVVRGSRAAIIDAAAYTSRRLVLSGVGPPHDIDVRLTTAGLFATLGTRPELGTFPAEAQARSGKAHVVVLADSFWRDAFGADPRIIGRLVRLNGSTDRVIAVASPTFRQPAIDSGFTLPQAWLMVPDGGLGTTYDREDHEFYVLARLAPGVSLATANAAIDRVVGNLRHSHPTDDATLGARAVPLTDSLVGGQRALFFGVFAAVVAVLLVACANVANLLLSRGASRERELSVRSAIGASRGRIVMQLLVEAFVLAAVGGALGIALAQGIVAAFVAFHPPSIPRADEVAIGGSTLLFTLGVVALTTIVAGLAPALTASRLDNATALKSAGRGGDAHRGARARDTFVAAEIAITLAIVIAAGLVLRSFTALTAQPLGFDATGLAALDVLSPRGASDAAIDAFHQRGLAAARALPGVRGAAWSFAVPFGSNRIETWTSVVGRSYAPGKTPLADLQIVSAGYFSVLRASLMSGRRFTQDDRLGTLPVAIVNESFVRRFFPAGKVIGSQIVPAVDTPGAPGPTKRTIVGVVADIRTAFAEPVEPTSYVPIRQLPIGSGSLLIARVPGTRPEAAAMRAIEALDPSLPTPQVIDVAGLVERSVAAERLGVVALGSLALVALVLAAAGIFAVVSFGVAQRTHEFGIRMALGASTWRVMGSVTIRALRLSCVGVVTGLILSAVCTHYLAGELFETSPLDPETFALVTVVIIGVAVVAALVPGLRATRVDPIVALRYE